MPYTGPISRPTSLDEMSERMSHTFSEEVRQAGLDFKPLPSDVIISPFGKSGTTWLQQTVHTLRTRGDTDFDDISRVVPWLETSTGLGLDLNAPQRAEPRAFKSHLTWHDVPKGARYIVSIRDPKDVVVSMFRFMEGWFFEAGTVTISELARQRFLAKAPEGYWNHLLSWWGQRDNPDVLLLSYEEMKRDFRATIHSVADFIGIPLDADLERIVLHNTSLDFMLAHKDKFDDLLMRQQSERMAGIPPGSDSAKVRNGQVGAHLHELPADIAAELDVVWQREVQPQTGFATYNDFRQAVRALTASASSA